MNVTESDSVFVVCQELLGDNLDINPPSNFLRYFAGGLSVILLIYLPLAFIHFMRNKAKYNRTSKRNSLMIGLYALGGVSNAFVIGVRIAYGSEKVSCPIYFLCASFLIFLNFIPAAVRLCSLTARIFYNRSLINFNFELLVKGNLRIKPGKATFAGEEDIKENGTNSGLQKLPEIDDVKSFVDSEGMGCGCCGIAGLCIALIQGIACWKKPRSVPSHLSFRYFLTTRRASNTLFVLILVVFFVGYFVLAYLLYDFGRGCFGCNSKQGSALTLIPLGIVSVLGAVFLWLLRKYPDSLGIKGELIFLGLSTTFVSFLMFVCSFLIAPELEEENDFQFVTFLLVLTLVTQAYAMTYQIYLGRREKGRGGDSSFRVFLDSTHGSRAFALYLATNLTLENMYFYKMVTSWKTLYDERSQEENDDTARGIYENYVSAVALNSINISHGTRDQAKVGYEEGTFPVTFFDVARDEVVYLMESDSFYLFQKSVYYRAYQSDHN